MLLISRLLVRRRRGLIIAPGILVLALIALTGWAGPAAAHVHVSSADTVPGGYATLEFKVPTESESASTEAFAITLPTATPFASVSTMVHPGWQVTQNEAKLPKPTKVGDFTLTKSVRTVTFTAENGRGIPPGEFDTFAVSVGPLPDKSGTTLSFAAKQTYSDGNVVAWDEPTPEGDTEPEHPAPTLTVQAPSVEAVAQVSDDRSDSFARLLGAGGLVLGAAALIVSLSRRNA